MADPQPTVSISPVAANIYVGDSVEFTASGGAGTGDYVWTGAAAGVGTTKEVQFTLVGVYQVYVYRNADVDYDQSNTAVATITVNNLPVVAPEFSPPGGTFSEPQLVSISSDTPGASFRYTTNGVNPTSSSGNLYTGPVPISGTVTLKAIGYRAGYPDSAVTSELFITLPAPPIVNIDATVLTGSAPLSTKISWTAQNADSVVVSGPGLSSAQPTDFKNYANLDVGSYTFSILAFNAGGSSQSSITVSSLSNAIDFYVVGTKTVHFFDRTIYVADTWLWEFGDGNSSTEQNPVHTYGFDGIFVVKLTAWCDGKPSTAIHTVSISGCFTGDPLPFTAEWDDLINEEIYPPWDDPRFSIDPESDYNNVLGFVASREGFDNRNWDVCPYVDWCYGPVTVGVAEARFKTRWTIYLDPTSKQWRWGKGSPTQEPPISLLPEMTSNPAYFNNVNFVSLSFAIDAKPYIAFQKGTNQVQVRYMNGASLVVRTFTGRTPKLFSECNIQPAADLCDVMVYYLKDDGMVYVRFQREEFLVEHAMQKPTLYGSELAVLTKVDDIRNNDVRRIYLYGYTLGQRKILLRSAQYPVFPSDTPTDVVLPPEFATQSVTLERGTYSPTAFIEFSSLLVGMENGYTDPGPRDAAGQTTEWEIGSYQPGHLDFGSQTTTMVSGALAIQVDYGYTDVTLTSGRHEFIARDFGYSHLTLNSGVNRIQVEKPISQITFDGGSNRVDREFAKSAMTLDNGSHNRHQEKPVYEITLDHGSHNRRQEKVISRQSLDRGRLNKNVDGMAIEINLDGANYRGALDSPVISSQTLAGGTYAPFPYNSNLFHQGTISANFTLENGTYHRGELLGAISSNFTLEQGSHTPYEAHILGFNYTLDKGSHARPLDQILSLQPTFENGSHPLMPIQAGESRISLHSGVHYFQIFTFDYEGSLPYVDPSQDDRWDSTQRTWDLDVTIQPDIA